MLQHRQSLLHFIRRPERQHENQSCGPEFRKPSSEIGLMRAVTCSQKYYEKYRQAIPLRVGGNPLCGVSSANRAILGVDLLIIEQ